jgi:hypothetical protein
MEASREGEGVGAAMELMSTSEDSKAEYMYVIVRGTRCSMSTPYLIFCFYFGFVTQLCKSWRMVRA